MAAGGKLGAMVPSAFLRVFQPLDAFEREEQLHWERYLLDGPGRAVAPPALCRSSNGGVAGAAGALRGRARRGPRGGRPHVREPHAPAPARPGRDAVVPRGPADGAVGAVRAQEGGPPGRQRPGSLPAARPIRRAVLPSESVARADPVVRAVPTTRSVGSPPTRRGAPTCTTAPRRDGRSGAPSRRSCRCAGPTWGRSAISSSTCTSGCTRSIRRRCWNSTTAAVDLAHVGRAGRRPQRPRRARGARGAGTRRVPTSRRRLPGRVEPMGRGRQPRSDELTAIGDRGSSDGGQGQNRTADTAVFSRVLYLLSYLAKPSRLKIWQKAPPGSVPDVQSLATRRPSRVRQRRFQTGF